MSGAAGRRGAALADVARLLPVYLWYGVLKRVIGLPRLARSAWQSPGPADPERARRAVAAVTRLSHRLSRADHDCLQRSLVLFRELSRAGAAPVFVLGFRREAEATAGHAWVEVAAAPGRSVLPEDVSSYTVAMSFREEGRLARTEATPAR